VKYPSPEEKTPRKGFPRTGYLKNYISSGNISVGDYTYYDDVKGPERFEHNVLYHHPHIGDKLLIGKFCAIAEGVKFLMNGANHNMSGFSTYPFHLFSNGWERVTPNEGVLPYKGNTVVGNDVWIGFEATIMPGVIIGSGAIIGTKALVANDVPPYSIVGGNPAKVIKYRFDESTIDALLEIAWWNWSAEKITEHLELIVGCDLTALRRVSVHSD